MTVGGMGFIPERLLMMMMMYTVHTKQRQTIFFNGRVVIDQLDDEEHDQYAGVKDDDDNGHSMLQPCRGAQIRTPPLLLPPSVYPPCYCHRHIIAPPRTPCYSRRRPSRRVTAGLRTYPSPPPLPCNHRHRQQLIQLLICSLFGCVCTCGGVPGCMRGRVAGAGGCVRVFGRVGGWVIA